MSARQSRETTWKARLLHVREKTNGIEAFAGSGVCPILNTAVDADDGKPVLRTQVARALRSWLGRLRVIVEQAEKVGETRPGVDSRAVATVIIASLEGALMMSRLQKSEGPLRSVQAHLNRYLDHEVAAE